MKLSVLSLGNIHLTWVDKDMVTFYDTELII